MDKPAPTSSLSPTQAPPNELVVPEGMGREEFYAMGTTISLLLPSTQLWAAATIRQHFADWERTLSRFLPKSELSRLNRGVGRPVMVSQLLFNVVQAALVAAEATEGLYDPTLRNQLVKIGYDRSFDELPATMPALETPTTPGGGWRGVRINAESQSITLPEGVGIDLGGIAKGMAVDAALVRLQLLGIETALVNAGGDLAVLGLPAHENSWPVVVQGLLCYSSPALRTRNLWCCSSALAAGNAKAPSLDRSAHRRACAEWTLVCDGRC